MKISERSAPLDNYQQFLTRLESQTAEMAVVGLGYVGLPLAVVLARAGLRVHGIEAALDRVAQINAGHSYISDVASVELAELVATGRLSASTSFEATASADAVIICVPTPLRKTKDPDISFILTALDNLLPHVHPGQLIVLESTTYPGTTEEVLETALEAKGFVVGRDVFLAFSPERVDPGNHAFNTSNIPKVVGGVTPACTRAAAALYALVTPRVHTVSSPRVAETTKLLENTFRSVNIALANELALACKTIKVDPWEVIEAAATKPFGFMAFYPGPGTGGHCIPLDPLYLSWKLRLSGFETRFIALADEINRSMPRHVCTLVADALNDAGRSVRNSRILLLGVTYKRDVSDVRESPALEVLRLLHEKGAQLDYADPYVPELTVEELKLTSVPLTPATLRQADCVVIVTDHAAFDYPLIAKEAPVVVDVRNALREAVGHREKIVTF